MSLENETVLMKPLRPVGIVGYGAYVPRYRLPAREVLATPSGRWVVAIRAISHLLRALPPSTSSTKALNSGRKAGLTKAPKRRRPICERLMPSRIAPAIVTRMTGQGISVRG